MTPMGSQLQNGAFRDFLGKIPLKTALVIYGAKRLLCYSILPWPVDQEKRKMWQTHQYLEEVCQENKSISCSLKGDLLCESAPSKYCSQILYVVLVFIYLHGKKNSAKNSIVLEMYKKYLHFSYAGALKHFSN